VVELASSLQWAAFQRLVELLQARETMCWSLSDLSTKQIMADENRQHSGKLRNGISEWLAKSHLTSSYRRHCPATSTLMQAIHCTEATNCSQNDWRPKRISKMVEGR